MTAGDCRGSHRITFTLHECLPWRVRRQGPLHTEYALLTRIGERMAECLQSVSKHHLQEILVFFDHILHDAPALWSTATGREEKEDDNNGMVDSRWRYLCGLTPKDWLRRYIGGFQPERRISFDLMRRRSIPCSTVLSTDHGQCGWE